MFGLALGGAKMRFLRILYENSRVESVFDILSEFSGRSLRGLQDDEFLRDKKVFLNI